MSEQTPEFGGNVVGRAAGNRGLDSATDRLEKEINRFADTLERFNSQMPKAPGGGGQQTSSANGGGATFSAAAATSHRYAGAHADTGPTSHRSGASTQTPFSGGAHRGPGVVAQHSSGVAKAAAGGLLGATAVYTANHYDNQTAGSTLAMMYGGGSDWQRAYQRGALGNYTAHGDADHWATISGMGQRSGYGMGTAGWKSVSGQVQSASAVNPGMSNQAALAGMTQAAGVGAINRMNAIGINPLGKNGMGDPRSIARQILSRMGSARVKTKAQADAAFAPNGSAVVTLDSYMASGFMQPGTRESVESEMRRILYAQVNGIEYAEYNRLATAAGAGAQTSAGKAAIDKLDAAGIATKTLPQKTAGKQGLARDSEGETVAGFVKGVSLATDTLEMFRGALNKILRIPGVGEAAGLFGGVGTVTPSGLPTGMSRGGDGPSSLSSYASNFGAAAGAASAGPGFGTGGVSARAGGRGGGSGSTGMSGGSSASRYGLGAVKPWVAKAAGIIGPKFGVRSILGVGSRGNVSDHPKGLALDFMCSKSAGDGIAAYAVANSASLNITYVIWRQRIWSINNPGWRSMEDRGSPTANHMDHVHISFLASPTNGDFSGMGGGGGLGQGLGSAVTVSTLGAGGSSPNNGFSAAGGYSEAAALGVGSSGYGIAGGGAGAGGSNFGGVRPTAGGGGSNNYNMGSSGGSSGSYGSAGGSGSLRVGTFNALFSNSTKQTAQDFNRISGKVDVLGWQELDKRKSGAWSKYMKNNEKDWGHHQSKYGDTAVSWNEDKYRALKRGDFDEVDSIRKGTNAKVRRGSAYVLLQDKETGAKFWAVSTHLQAHRQWGSAYAKTQDKQIAQIASLYARLRKTGIPVISVGDFNNMNPGHAKGADRTGKGIDQIYAGGGTVTGGGSMGTNSDHPFVYANISLPGGKSSGNGGTPAQNMALGRSMAAQRGWSGAQWSALRQLWMKESGWRTDADNPSSSAYGIPQAMTSVHNMPKGYMTDPKAQIQWGLNYIASRYGTPSNAMAFWKKNNYYKSGAWNVSEDQTADIHQGEMVLSSKVAAAVRSEITGNRRNGPAGGGGVVFQPGAIVIKISGGTGRQEMVNAGRQVVDAIVEDSRFKALAEGV